LIKDFFTAGLLFSNQQTN